MPEFNQTWLRCKIDSGMFSDEVAVTYPATEAWRKSVFVPRKCVRNSDQEFGEVIVKIVSKGEALFAVLPSSQKDIVKVEASDLHAA